MNQDSKEWKIQTLSSYFIYFFLALSCSVSFYFIVNCLEPGLQISVILKASNEEIFCQRESALGLFDC